MSEKQPLTEGNVRGVQKGTTTSPESNNIKPTQPPPAPVPPTPPVTNSN